MAHFVIEYTPPQLVHAPRNWYVSPYTQSSPIVVFTTKQEAIAYARSLPQEYAGDGPFSLASIPVSVQIDWIHATDKEPLSFLISRTRQIVDMRLRSIPVHVLPAKGDSGAYLLASVRTGNVLTVDGKFGGDGDLMLFESSRQAEDWINSQPGDTPRRYILVENCQETA